MARVKDQDEASNMTIVSKNRRWARLTVLFGIKRLSELFPANAVPNDAGDDHLKCSGDVLRDLCMIGESLSKRGIKKDQMRSRVKRSFTPGIQVRHADIRELLDRVRSNAFQNAIQAGYDRDFVASQLAGNNDTDTAPTGTIDELVVDTKEDDLDIADQANSSVDNAHKSSDTAISESEKPFITAIEALGDEVYTSIEDEAKEPRSKETTSTRYSYFDDVGLKGPRKAKARASVGITEITEMEESGDEHNDEDNQDRQEVEPEYEEDDVIPAHIIKTGMASSRYLSSLRPIHEDGFADTYASDQCGVSKDKSRKRKSAPAALETGPKRLRSSLTSSSTVYDQSERDTLVSCLRMTHALLVGIDQTLEGEDIDGAQNQVGIVQGMVEQVLKRYAD